jgi:hypothetical protein
MTTYHFNRGSGKITAKHTTLTGYFQFLGWLILFTFLHILNIPSFFGGDFNLFLFEISLFYLLFIERNILHLFTIFTFYLLLDVLEAKVLGLSFLSFLISFAITSAFFNFLILRNKVANFNTLKVCLLLFCFLIIFCLVKIFLLHVLTQTQTSFQFISLIFKSIIYSTFLFANFLLIFGRKL